MKHKTISLAALVFILTIFSLHAQSNEYQWNDNKISFNIPQTLTILQNTSNYYHAVSSDKLFSITMLPIEQTILDKNEWSSEVNSIARKLQFIGDQAKSGEFFKEGDLEGYYIIASPNHVEFYDYVIIALIQNSNTKEQFQAQIAYYKNDQSSALKILHSMQYN